MKPSYFKILLFTTIFLITWVAKGQIVYNIDSLKQVVKAHPEDCNSLTKFSQAYLQSKPDSAEYLAKKVLYGCGKNDPDFSGRAYNVIGLCRLADNQLDSAEIYFKKSINITHNANLKFVEGVYISNLAQIYLRKGKIADAIEKYKIAEDLIKTYNYDNKADYFLATTYSGIGEAYDHLGLYDKALEALFKSYEAFIKIQEFNNMGITMSNIANVYDDMGDYDQSVTYNRKALEHFNQSNYSLAKAMIYYSLADNAFKMKTFDKAKVLLDSSMLISKENKLTYNLGNVYNLYGLLALEQHDFTLSKQYFNEGLKINEKTGSLFNTGESYQCLGDLYYKLDDHQQAHYYYNKALQLFDKEDIVKEKKDIIGKLLALETVVSNKDSLHYYLDLNNTTNLKYLNSEKQKAITAQEVIYDTKLKENLIQEQSLQLEVEKNRRQKLTYGIGLLLIFGLGILMWSYNLRRRMQLEAQNQMLDMQLTMNQMELNNLNQQLDPHEFKNILQGITPEIQDKAPEAYKHLIKLLNLTKSTLGNKKITDSLSNQITQIESYLNLQKNILPFQLTWEINQNNSNPKRQIPRLLLKNLVENSIKHGIKPKNADSQIIVDIFEKNNMLFIKVTDDGIGINLKRENTGLGINTYKNLFAILNRQNKQKANLKIENLNNGVLVTVIIPINYKYSSNDL